MNSLKHPHDSYEKALLAYMDNTLFPRSIAARIRTQMQNITYTKEEEDSSHHVESSPNKNTPIEEDECITAAIGVSKMGQEQESNQSLDDFINDAEFSETDLEGFDRGLKFDWSQNFDQTAVHHLLRYTK